MNSRRGKTRRASPVADSPPRGDSFFGCLKCRWWRLARAPLAGLLTRLDPGLGWRTAMPETVRLVARLDAVATVREPVQQSRAHLRVAKYAGPRLKAQVAGDHHRLKRFVPALRSNRCATKRSCRCLRCLRGDGQDGSRRAGRVISRLKTTSLRGKT